jgi:trehalose utilization protein
MKRALGLGACLLIGGVLGSPSESAEPTAGKSRVFYFMPGHGPTQYNNPGYREVVARGIRWAAGRLN